jgi:putative tricarboxylic transport membrane protein
MGVTPGGAIAASFMGYGLAKRFSKRPKLRQGRDRGRARARDRGPCAGTSALAADAGARHSRLRDGGVLLGGLLVWGLQPGPLLFVEQKDFVWGLIASMYLGNLAGLVIVLRPCRCSPRSCACRFPMSRR